MGADTEDDIREEDIRKTERWIVISGVVIFGTWIVVTCEGVALPGLRRLHEVVPLWGKVLVYFVMVWSTGWANSDATDKERNDGTLLSKMISIASWTAVFVSWPVFMAFLGPWSSWTEGLTFYAAIALAFPLMRLVEMLYAGKRHRK